MVEKAFRHLAERAIDDDLRGEQCKLLTAIDFGIPNENGTGGDGTMLQTMNTLRVSSLNQRKEKMKNNKKKEDSLEFLFQKMFSYIILFLYMSPSLVSLTFVEVDDIDALGSSDFVSS